MKINWIVIAVVGVIAVLVIAITVVRNQSEKKKLEHKLNNDFHHDESLDSDPNDDDAMR